MKLALGLTFGGMNPAALPPGMVAGTTITITPSFVDGIATGGTWVPDGAIAAADFVNGRYYANGAETTLLGMFEEEPVNWGPWAAAVVDGVGMGEGNGPGLTAAAATGLLGGFTVVLSGETDTSATELATLQIVDMPAWVDFGVAALKDGSEAIIADDPVFLEAFSSIGNLTTGSHKGAFTIIPSKIAVSVDGETAVTTAASASVAFNFIGLSVGAGSTLETVTFYSPQDDADLPALSA